MEELLDAWLRVLATVCRLIIDALNGRSRVMFGSGISLSPPTPGTSSISSVFITVPSFFDASAT